MNDELLAALLQRGLQEAASHLDRPESACKTEKKRK